jgi:hypothetical protein
MDKVLLQLSQELSAYSTNIDPMSGHLESAIGYAKEDTIREVGDLLYEILTREENGN